MHNNDRFKLLYGPYRMPKCKVGKSLRCRIRGEVKVIGITDALIQWPYTLQDGGIGHKMLIVCGDLARAIERESSTAIRYWFGVCNSTVWKWRKALGVQRFNE